MGASIVKTRAASARRETFPLVLIKPSHYDDDGYVIQWFRSEVPSNTLAVLNALARECQQEQVLGGDVDITIQTIDEVNTRVRPNAIIRAIRKAGGRSLVGLVGVQSNQYPRALDLARQFRAAGIPVIIGGFHVSGSLSMLPEAPPGLQDAWDLGVSLFAGEAEGRFGLVLKDAYDGTLKPLYNYLKDLPGLEGAVIPYPPKESLARNISPESTLDSGRGCPFQCSFCTIINVQGRKSRYRSPDDIERALRESYDRGIRAMFLTDDNFARNKSWESIFDRIIQLRERDGIAFRLMIQVDTLCHLIPNFVEKAGRAGVRYVFIGLENINQDNLLAAKKKQNRIGDYRAMLLKWKAVGATTFCGYIIGFPNDTRERVLNDIEIIKRELPIDVLEFFVLTPLPGSEDHQNWSKQGVWLEPDLNKYETEHVCIDHPLMSRKEWEETYDEAWRRYYSPDHVETLMRRGAASGMSPLRLMFTALFGYALPAIWGVHPLQGGIFRLKYRTDRRHGMAIEHPLVFYPKYAWGILTMHAKLAGWALTCLRRYRRVVKDPNKLSYMDQALTPPPAEEPVRKAKPNKFKLQKAENAAPLVAAE